MLVVDHGAHATKVLRHLRKVVTKIATGAEVFEEAVYYSELHTLHTRFLHVASRATGHASDGKMQALRQSHGNNMHAARKASRLCVRPPLLRTSVRLVTAAGTLQAVNSGEAQGVSFTEWKGAEAAERYFREE